VSRSVIGALNLFNTTPGALDDDKRHIGQALADMATVGLLQHREIRRHNTLIGQLQTVLNSRIIIEQAKGVIAERRRLEMDQSFTLLRATARATNRRLSELAEAVVNGSGPL
jgi:AmiR/NasT family two-component response regulator